MNRDWHAHSRYGAGLLILLAIYFSTARLGLMLDAVSGFATLVWPPTGLALPGAVAAALHDPTRRIVAAMGDGGFLMNSQELETAKRLGVAFTVLVFNDNDYGLISWKQAMSRGRSTGTRLTNPDFKAYAESFGIPGYRPRTLEELAQQLREAVTSRKLCVMEIPIDQSVNAELIKTLRATQQ